jgi:hypothetical protein
MSYTRWKAEQAAWGTIPLFLQLALLFIRLMVFVLFIPVFLIMALRPVAGAPPMSKPQIRGWRAPEEWDATVTGLLIGGVLAGLVGAPALLVFGTKSHSTGVGVGFIIVGVVCAVALRLRSPVHPADEPEQDRKSRSSFNSPGAIDADLRQFEHESADLEALNIERAWLHTLNERNQRLAVMLRLSNLTAVGDEDDEKRRELNAWVEELAHSYDARMALHARLAELVTYAMSPAVSLDAPPTERLKQAWRNEQQRNAHVRSLVKTMTRALDTVDIPDDVLIDQLLACLDGMSTESISMSAEISQLYDAITVETNAISGSFEKFRAEVNRAC